MVLFFFPLPPFFFLVSQALNALVQAVAVMGLMEQFGILRDYLGHALSMVALYRFARSLYYKLTGQLPPANPADLNVAKFEEFQQAASSSKKPLLIFLAILVGIPLLLSTLLRKPKAKPFEIGPNGRPVLPNGERPEVAKALYPFAGQNRESFSLRFLVFPTLKKLCVCAVEMEISFQSGNEIHVLSRADPRGNPVEWWKGYTVDPNMQGPPRIGMFPGNYVEIVNGNPEVPPRPAQVQQQQQKRNRGQLVRAGTSPAASGAQKPKKPTPQEFEQEFADGEQQQNPLLTAFGKEQEPSSN